MTPPIITNNTFLYHGSPNRFDTFNYHTIGEHGTSEGYGFYLTTNPAVAKQYTFIKRNDTVGYFYTVKLDLQQALSYTHITLEAETCINIIHQIHEMMNTYDPTNEYHHVLDMINDTNTYGIDRVMNELLRLLFNNQNDVDIYCELINICGSIEHVAKAFVKHGYNHIIAHVPEAGENHAIVIALDPNDIRILHVDTITRS